MDDRSMVTPAESQCQRLGDLAARAAPDEEHAPDSAAWAAIEHALDQPSPHRALRRSAPVLAFAAIALLSVGGWLVARRPLGFRVQGCSLAGDGRVTDLVGVPGRIDFDDGSAVVLDRGARLRVNALAYRRGAEITLEEGGSTLSVVHREKARWAILAGPFRVDVTGTRFDVSWSAPRGRFRLAMRQGEVRVSGGPLATATALHEGQLLESDLTQFTVAITDARAAEQESPRKQAEGSGRGQAHGSAGVVPASPEAPRTPATKSSARKRKEAGLDSLTGAKEASPQVVVPAHSKPTNLESPVVADPRAAGMEPAWPSPSRTRVPVPPAQGAAMAPVGSGSRTVAIGADGNLAGGFTGFAWIAGGDGTSFSSPTSWEGREHLLPEDGRLCASGTVAAWNCVNEGTPRISCNWGRNWGVAIGWHARADQKAWGEEASSAIAVEFHGRSSSYRLNAHVKGDPSEKIYCIENYKSGQVARPSMFKTSCWSNEGATLPDFQGVESFNLQFSSGFEYVAFRYCVLGITVYR